MYLLCHFGAVVNFMSREDTGKSLWEEMVLLLSSRARGFSSIWFLQHRQLLQHQTPHCSVCNLSSTPPSVLQSSKSIQQAALSLWGVYIGILLVTTSTFYHGKREVSSTCVTPPYNFSAIQRAMVMTFPAESGCQPRVGEALFLELSKYRNNDFSFYLLYSISGLPNQALITLISSYNY